MMRALALLAVLIAALPAAAHAATFDGGWNVIILCPNTADGVVGYTLQFTAEVKGGVLHGQQGTAGKPSSLALDGTIEADGTAKLSVKGRTGATIFTTNNAQEGTPYSYDVTARFNGSRGTGSRVGGRVCNFSFQKL